MKKTLTFVLVAILMTFAGAQSVSAAFGYGGGSSRAGNNFVRPITPAVTPVTPVVGKVLGASDFKFTSHLSQGTSHDAVKQLQERLRAEGHFTFHTSTGFFGPITLAAVKAYQTAHGIPATGFVGPLTIAELNK